MESKKNITRREAIKKIGLSALALTAGADVAKAIAPSGNVAAVGNGNPTDAKELEFAKQWTQTMLDGLAEQKPDGNLTEVNMREVMRKCSRACYDRHNFDEAIKEADLNALLDSAHEVFGWNVDYDKSAGKIVVYENNTECLCPLAKACKGKVAQSLCTCSETELERIFSRAYGGRVTAKVVESVLKGNAMCVYHIQLEGKN